MFTHNMQQYCVSIYNIRFVNTDLPKSKIHACNGPNKKIKFANSDPVIENSLPAPTERRLTRHSSGYPETVQRGHLYLSVPSLCNFLQTSPSHLSVGDRSQTVIDRLLGFITAIHSKPIQYYKAFCESASHPIPSGRVLAVTDWSVFVIGLGRPQCCRSSFLPDHPPMQAAPLDPFRDKAAVEQVLHFLVLKSRLGIFLENI